LEATQNLKFPGENWIVNAMFMRCLSTKTLRGVSLKAAALSNFSAQESSSVLILALISKGNRSAGRDVIFCCSGNISWQHSCPRSTFFWATRYPQKENSRSFDPCRPRWSRSRSKWRRSARHTRESDRAPRRCPPTGWRCSTCSRRSCSHRRDCRRSQMPTRRSNPYHLAPKFLYAWYKSETVVTHVIC